MHKLIGIVAVQILDQVAVADHFRISMTIALAKIRRRGVSNLPRCTKSYTADAYCRTKIAVS